MISHLLRYSASARFTRVVAIFLVGIVSLSCAMSGVASAQTSHNCLPSTLPDSTAQTVAREATSILVDSAWADFRQEHGIPSGTAADVSIVQDNAVCASAMAAFEARTQRQFPEAFVIVRMGQAAPFFYLMTPRRDGALTNRYVLDGSFTLIGLIGSD